MKYQIICIVSCLIWAIGCHPQNKSEVAENENNKEEAMRKDLLKVNIADLKLEDFKDEVGYKEGLSESF